MWELGSVFRRNPTNYWNKLKEAGVTVESQLLIDLSMCPSRLIHCYSDPHDHIEGSVSFLESLVIAKRGWHVVTPIHGVQQNSSKQAGCNKNGKLTKNPHPILHRTGSAAGLLAVVWSLIVKFENAVGVARFSFYEFGATGSYSWWLRVPGWIKSTPEGTSDDFFARHDRSLVGLFSTVYCVIRYGYLKQYCITSLEKNRVTQTSDKKVRGSRRHLRHKRLTQCDCTVMWMTYETIVIIVVHRGTNK